jgi:hypothetical protein
MQFMPGPVAFSTGGATQLLSAVLAAEVRRSGCRSGNGPEREAHVMKSILIATDGCQSSREALSNGQSRDDHELSSGRVAGATVRPVPSIRLLPSA